MRLFIKYIDPKLFQLGHLYLSVQKKLKLTVFSDF